MEPEKPLPPPPPQPRVSENYSLTLETLRTLHAAASSRWANRREYEWKLSYAIWTAIAGFIAVVVLGKDSAFVPVSIDWHHYPTWLLIFVLTLPTALHFYYLKGMVARTLNDLDLFDEIEHCIRLVDPWVAANLTTRFFSSDVFGRTGWKRKYGLVAQIGITILLSVAAFWFVTRSRLDPKANDKPTHMNCQPVVYLPAPSSISSPAVGKPKPAKRP